MSEAAIRLPVIMRYFAVIYAQVGTDNSCVFLWYVEGCRQDLQPRLGLHLDSPPMQPTQGRRVHSLAEVRDGRCQARTKCLR